MRITSLFLYGRVLDAGNFQVERDDKTLIDIRATISAELIDRGVCNGRRTRGRGRHARDEIDWLNKSLSNKQHGPFN